ncbi:MAG TPA: endonuclease III [Firmicutes bacterium]|nr:endonuclease III [Bacillota bacterium]
MYCNDPTASPDLPLLPQIKGDAMDVLVATILSQATTDASAKVCFDRLKRAFPAWRDALNASQDEIAGLIRSCGLSSQKASAIKRILDFTKGTLDHLRGISPEEAYSTLLSLPGVGPKTAACVMLFAFDRPFMPVDTHIRRVAGRLGLVPAKANAPQVQYLLQKVVPAEIAGKLHVLLIRHGRKLCTARSPKCVRCTLSRNCDYYSSSVVGSRVAASPGAGSPEPSMDSSGASSSRTGSMSGKAAMSLPQ